MDTTDTGEQQVGQEAGPNGSTQEGAPAGEGVAGEVDGATSALAKELESLKRSLDEEKDKHLRLLAEFENFKRRALKEQSELLKYQGERIVVDMLEVLDNLDLALMHSSAEYDKLKTGLEMIQKLFVERLGKWGIKGETGVGQSFDPQRYAAISRVPGSGQPPGTIVGELKKAFYYKDKLIRPGEVVVAADSE